MNWFYSMVEILTSFIEIYVLYRIFDQFFEKKDSKVKHSLMQLLLVVAITALTLWLNSFSLFSYLTVSVGLLIISFASKLLYKNSFFYALTISIVYIVLINALDFLTISIVELLFNVKGVTIEVMTSTGAYRCALALGMKALLVLLYNIFVRRMNMRIPFNKKICITIITSSIFCFLCMQYLIEAVVIGNVADMRKAVLVAWLFIILFVVSFVLIIKYNIKFSAERLTNSIIATRLEVLEEDNKTLNNAYSDLAKLAHDFKKHMNAMSIMAQNQKYETLAKYLQQIAADVENIQILSFTGVESVDAVINNKLSIAKKNNIELMVKVTPIYNLAIRDMDLCAVVVNLLDNAIAATMTIDDVYKRKVELNISIIHSMILIKVTNGYSSEDAQSQNKPTRTNDGFHVHGYGLEIVKTLAQKYDGSFDAKKNDGVFVATVMLSNGD